MSRSDVAGPGGRSLSVAQSLDLGAFLLMSLRHGALNLGTLMLFSFWGRSETRRRIWAASALGGDRLVYGGSGAELLVGFSLKLLIAGGALAFAVASVRGLETWGAVGALAAGAGAIFALGFCRFVGFVYLASRTEWRGAAFEVEGSSRRFAMDELRAAAMNILTLGWWRPRADRLRAERLWGGLRHQGLALWYDPAAARRRPLYSAFAIGWFGSVMVLLFAAGVLLGLDAGLFPTPELGAAPSGDQLAALAGLGAGAWLAVSAAWAPYRAALRSATAAALGLRLSATWRECARLEVENVLLRIVSLGALAPLAQAREAAFLFSHLGGGRLSNPARVARLSPDACKASVMTRGKVHAVHAADLRERASL